MTFGATLGERQESFYRKSGGDIKLPAFGEFDRERYASVSTANYCKTVKCSIGVLNSGSFIASEDSEFNSLRCVHFAKLLNCVVHIELDTQAYIQAVKVTAEKLKSKQACDVKESEVKVVECDDTCSLTQSKVDSLSSKALMGAMAQINKAVVQENAALFQTEVLSSLTAKKIMAIECSKLGNLVAVNDIQLTKCKGSLSLSAPLVELKDCNLETLTLKNRCKVTLSGGRVERVKFEEAGGKVIYENNASVGQVDHG